MTQDEMKQAVARAAIEHVPQDCIVGVGTGSTANFFIAELARIKGRIEGAVASSEATAGRLRAAGIPVLDLNAVDELPVYVDGADEVTQRMHMIKGGGGALTREKVVAAVADKFVCIADESKLKDVLGAFHRGLKVDVAETMPSREYVRQIGEVRALQGAVNKLGANGPAGTAAAVEFVLEGLHLHRKLNKETQAGRYRYRG